MTISTSPRSVRHRLALVLVTLLFTLVPLLGRAVGTWVPVTNTAPNSFGVQPIFILPDGTVMCGSGGNTAWYRLSPDTHGSYLNGSWSTVAPMHYTRRFMSSQVLPSAGGQLYVAGGEYGTGKDNAEMYNITNNTWTVLPTPPDEIIDNISETLPNGDILEGAPSDDTRIFSVSSNSWSLPITPISGQDEASWVKLQDGSIITIDPFGTNTERFIPSLNKWVADSPVPVPMYGYAGELGGGLLLPTGQAIFFGASGSNCVYTPWTTNGQGMYTPAGATNVGTWTAVSVTPNFNAPIDAPAAMMVNGNILCCMEPTNNSYGPSSCNFYEYNPVSNVFTQINGPTGTSAFGASCETITLLAMPDGSILMSSGNPQLYEYQPGGSPLTNGIPHIVNVTTNSDGSFHLTGTGFNGITEGGVFGDDTQVNSDYPIARFTNSTGNTLYARTYNWSTCNLMTGTNVVSCDMALPAGMTAGTFPVVVAANGIASAPYSLSVIGTPLPTVAGLAFSNVSSNQMSFYWNKINISETGYFIQRSTDAVNFATIAAVASTVTNYTDTGVTPLGEYYYRVLGTNGTGLTGLACAPILAASPGVYPVSAPWSSQDVGAVIGAGTAATNGSTYTLIGSGNGIGADNDQCQFAWQPVAGDFTLTARLTASQNTGTNALVGVMLRNSTGNDVASAMMGFNPVLQVPVFEHRMDAAGVARYGIKVVAADGGDGDALAGNNSAGLATSSFGAAQISAPVWLRLVRAGNLITGYSSLDGTNWTLAGTATCDLAAVADIGLAVTSGTYNLLNLSTFDNVTVTGTNALVPPPVAEWKLDETGGLAAEDSIDGFDGAYNNVTLGLPGATPDTGTAAGFNGTSANITIPALNLNSNVVTITTWMYRTVNEPADAGVFFNRANSTVSGIDFYNAANVLGYTWNNNASTYGWNSGLTVPSNTWTFVALVISPTNAVMYMGTNNGVLLSATNNVANAVQGFDGTSYIGQDPSSGSRYFNGQLDQVQFFNQRLTAPQLASFIAAPVINFTSPTNGLAMIVPATFNVTAALSSTNGHVINLVQFYTNGTMFAAYPAPPYTNTLSALPAGIYSVSARLFYDSGSEVDADVATVFVENAVGTPTNLVATAVSSNLVNITWSAGTNAMGYILSRGGSPIATLSGTSYADYGLSGGVNYCYTIVATNLASTSAASPSSCVTTPVAGDALVWNATRSPAGPQDGSGFWGGTTTNWWNGSANVAWADGNVAYFGVGTATNYTVTLTNSVTPSGFAFSAAGAGAYTITGSTNYSILTSSNLTFSVDGNATILSALYGTNNLIKNGSGTLTLSNASPSYVGTVTINDGALVMPAGPSVVNLGYVIGTNGALFQGYSTGGGYTKGIVINGGGLTAGSGLYLASGVTLNEQNITISNAPTLITGYGSGANGQLESFDINADNFVVVAAASGSVIDTTVNINVSGGYGMRMNIASGANTASGDLVVNGLVVGGSNELRKYGAGSLRLAGTNTYSAGTLVAAGSLQLAGPSSPLGTGIVNYSASGTLQAIVSSYLPNGFSLNSGVTLTVDTLTNELTIAGAITNLGKLYKISPGILALAGVNTYTNTTIIGAGTLQVDGVMGTTAITISNNATLAGTGVLTATPTLLSGSYFAPGDSGVGTLTVSNNLTLNAGSKTLMQVGDYSGVTSNDQAVVTGTFAYAGSLIVSNIGTSPLAGGDTFQLFNAAAHSGGFTNVTLPALATGLVWNTNSLISAGTISVGYVQETLTYNAGANGTISGSTPQTINYGSSGTAVTAVPNTGYHFVNWSDSSVANPRTDTGVTNNLTVTANFAINTYTLTYTAGTNGTLSGTTPQTVNYGANGTAITPVPNTGYHFVNWSDGSVANPRTDTSVSSNVTVTANFAINTYTLTYTAGTNGTVSGTSPQTVNYGASGTAVTPVPSTGYHFVNWSDGSVANPRTDTGVTNNITVTANFAINTYTLTYTAGTNGTLSGTSPQTVNYNASGTAVTAVPGTGYHFVNWSDSSVANPRTDSGVTNNITVTANFAINTYTLTYSAVTNGTISGTSPQTVNYGASGTAVTAVPSTGYSFTNWSDGSVANPRTDTGVTNDITVAASFIINTYTLTYTAGTNGTLSGTTPQTVSYGANGTAITAVPNTGYSFVNWSDGSVANPRTDTGVTNSLAVTANFAINTYTLTYTAGTNGTLSGTTPQTVNYGANGTAITPVPSTGYHFVNWSDGSVANPRTDTGVTSNLTVTANFAINTYTLTYTAGTNGTVSGTSPQTVNYGASGTAMTPVPGTGYHFVNWSDGSVANPRTDTGVTNNITVTANFAINTYTLTYTAGTNGTVSGTSPQTVNYGASGTAITAVPNSGYVFFNWSDGSTANPRTDTGVTNNITVTANFAVGSFTLTYTAGANGTVSGSSPQVVSYGASGTAVTALPASGYAFTNWSDGSTADPRTDVSVSSNISVTANFVSITNGPLAWTGGGTDGNWSTAGNWNWAVPANGQPLTFQGATQPANTNDFLTAVGQITFNNDGFALAGQAVTLQGNLLSLAGANTLSLGTTLGAAASFVSSNGILTVSGAVTNGGYTLTLDGPSSNVVSGVISGSGPLVKNGTGTAVLSGASTFTNAVTVNAGTLQVTAKSGDVVYTIAQGATLQIGYTTAGGYANTAMTINGNGTAATSGFYLAGGKTYNCSGKVTLQTAPTTIRQYGTGLAKIGTFDINGVGIHCTAAASGSTLDPNIQLVSDGYGMTIQADAGTNTATGDVVVNGPLNVGSLGFYKEGTGSLVLNGQAATGNTAVQVKAGTLLCGVTNCLGVNASVPVSSGALLELNGLNETIGSLNGAAGSTVDFGGTGTLTVSNPPVLAGTVDMVLNPGTVTGSELVLQNGTLTNGGTLVVTVTGTNALVAGDTFQLFNAPAFAGGFTNITLPTLATGLVWTNNINVNGTLSVGYVTETLTYTAGANGAVSGTSPQTVNYGASGTAVTPVPSTGYHFVNWSDGSVANPRTDTGVTNNITVTANFAINTYTLTYTAGTNGTVSGTSPQTVNYNASGTAVTAVANSGYSFTTWSDGSSANPRTDSNVTSNITVTASFVATSTNYAALLLAQGPNSYWRLGETNGASSLADASGNGHTATPQGTGLVLGVAGPQAPAYPLFETTNTAAQFNGASNYISGGTAASLAGTNDFTISAWVKTTAATTTGVILQQRDVANYVGEYQLAVNPAGTVSFYIYGSGGYQFNFTTTQAVNDGQWHTIMAERSGGTNGYIYIDGILAASASGASQSLTGTINTYIGRDVRNLNNTFNGQIDEVAIFTRALATNQIAQLSNTNRYLLPAQWSSNAVGTVATETTATYFSKAFTVGGAGAGIATNSDSFSFVSLPLTNSLTITAQIGSLQTNGTAPLAGVMVRSGTNAGAVFAFMGLTSTNSAKWIYRSTSNSISSSTTFTNLPLPYWVRLVRSTNTFTGFVSSNGTAWVQSASVTLTNLATNALVGLAVSSGVSNVLDEAVFNSVTVTNGGVLYYQPLLIPQPAPPAYAYLDSFTVGYGTANFTITGDEGSVWRIESSDDLVNWTTVETVTLIGGSVSQTQSDNARPARYFRLVQVQ